MKTKHLFIIAVLLGLHSVNTIAQVNRNTNQNFISKLPFWMTENKVPCVGVCLIENSKVSFSKVYGELKQGIPAPQNTIFNIASITKPVVAVITLKLVELGQWDLDEPLYKYWIEPDVANDNRLRKLTTRYVLSHQSGFPNWRSSKKLKFEFEPGTKYQYSGEGFEYLRKALENKLNKSLATLSDSILFKPLGMNSTFFVWNDTIKKRIAIGHNGNGNVYEGQNWGNINAAGSILTTVDDFGKFLIHVMNGAGLSKKLYHEMIRPQVNIKEHVDKGLGWQLVGNLPNGECAIEHGGSNPGFQSMSVILPKWKRAVIVFTNGDNGMFIYNNIIKGTFDLGAKFLETSNDSYNASVIELSNEELDKYVGTYARQDLDGYFLYVTRKGNDLITSGNAIPTMKILPEAKNKFFIEESPYQIEFIKAENDNVIRLNISEKGKLILFANKIN